MKWCNVALILSQCLLVVGLIGMLITAPLSDRMTTLMLMVIMADSFANGLMLGVAYAHHKRQRQSTQLVTWL